MRIFASMPVCDGSSLLELRKVESWHKPVSRLRWKNIGLDVP